MNHIRAAFITLLIASVALAAYGDRISGNGPEFLPRDPGAARKNLSNVDAATGRSALNLGTMATEAKTDYVATDTFTAHVTDNSDVHGCTAIASASAVADALSACNASDALNLRLDGSRAMTGNLRLGGKWLSNDGGDEGVYITTDGKAGIGTATPSYLLGVRGASQGSAFSTNSDATWVYQEIAVPATINETGRGIKFSLGNETAGAGILGIAENQTGGIFNLAFLTSNGNTNYERMRITYGGNVLIGTTSDNGTNKLQVNGSIYATGLTTSGPIGYSRFQCILDAGASVKTSIYFGLTDCKEIFILMPVAADNSLGTYYAIADRYGTDFNVTELANAGYYSLSLDGGYLKITNTHSGTIYGACRVRHVTSETD